MGELIAELTEAFGAAEQEVRDGVLGVVGQLVDEELLLIDVDRSEGAERLASPADLGTPCAPCLASLDALGWAGSVPVAFGDLLTGVRATTDAGLTVVERVLAPLIVEAQEAAVHYSLVVPEAGTGRGAQALTQLYFGHRLLVRTRSQARALRALVAHLDGHLDSTRSERLLLGGRALVRGDDVVLLSPDFANDLDAAEPRLRRLGVSVRDAPSCGLGVPGEVLLPSPTLEVDHEALARLEREEPAVREPGQPDPGPRRLAGWILPTLPGVEALSGPDALRAVLTTVRNLGAFGSAPGLDHLTDHLAKVPVRSLSPGEPGRLADAVADLLDA